MGLIKAAMGAAGGVLADQWREFFYCEALPVDVMVKKGKKKASSRSSNTSGSDNVISNGSIIAVADGQCMIIVEQGKVVDMCAEPGEYTYDMSTEPSLFYGDLSTNIVEVFKNIGKRFTFGGEAPKDQRVYYFNTKELMGNKYGTPTTIPFRVVDNNIGLDMDVSIKCFGEYSYRITNPILFYTNVCGNVEADYKRSEIESQMKSELLTALQPAFAKISDMGIRYSSLPGHTMEMADALNEVLSNRWRDLRGIEIVAFGVSSIKANEEDEQMIKELQRNATFRNPTMAAAQMVGAQSSAMQKAAENPNGAMMGFMGMNMAQQAGGMNAESLFQMGQQQQMQQQQMQMQQQQMQQQQMQQQQMQQQQMQQQPSQPAPLEGWTCSCGATGNTGKFCMNCGSAKPIQPEGWTCSCGAINKGKFCMECGSPKPAGVPQYRCDKCGWEPEKGVKPPKFCPECGDPFDDGDIV